MTGTELLVGGWFASPVIGRVIQKAQNYLGANYELQKGTQGMIETLTHTLVLTQATVKEVEKRAIVNNPELAIWLRMLKDAVYDAENVLDDMEAKSIKEKVQGKNKVSKLASSSLSALVHMFLPDDKNKNLKEVVDKLKHLSADITNFVSLVNMNQNYEAHMGEVVDHRETISQPPDVGLYYRQDELDLILEIILGIESENRKKAVQNYNNYHGIFVIPIVGIGGVGKTALAQAVYNNPEVEQTCTSKAWISVSCNLDAVLVMRKIIQSLQGFLRLDVITLEDISRSLSLIIRGAKFIIVLDGMFKNIENQWEYLYATLSHGAPGSVVLITTQNEAFANTVGTFGPIALSTLESGNLWKILKRFALGNVVMPEEKKIILKQIGKKITEKLRGLPLAAKIIGNILRSNLDEDRWRRISQSEWWDIPEGKSQILPSIGLGYEHLEPYLRQCFAYCSIFPRNSVIEKDRLVQMWIAHNFIPHDARGARMEDVGRQWFDKLVEMSFFQLTGDTKGYVVPDLMHDLAIIVSSDECFYLTDTLVEIPPGVRHLAVDTRNLEAIKSIQNCKHLRSLLYFGFCQVDGMYSTINDLLCKSDGIRVLDLSYLFMETKEPPSAIQNLNHLRFLDLSSTGIEVLTRTTFYHYHLQSLHIQKCEFLQLPKGFNKLINLRHLNAEVEIVAQISGIGKLINLQELGTFKADIKYGYRITELENLTEITGALKVIDCHKIESKEEAMQAKLADKKHLESIELIWSPPIRTPSRDSGIFEALKPHDNIKKLTIRKYLGPSFPDWLMQTSRFQYLQTVRLYDCMNVNVLPPLGKLPSLKNLELLGLNAIKILDQSFYGNNSTVFPVLTYLYIDDQSIEEWTEAPDQEFFPHLSTLNINKHKALREAPIHCFGASLKNLILTNCQNLNSIEKSLPYLSCLIQLHINFYDLSISLNLDDLKLLEDLNLSDCPEMSIQGSLQSLSNLKYIQISTCPKLIAVSKQKGKGLQIHQTEGLRSLLRLGVDQSLMNHDYHLILGKLPSVRVLNCRNSELRHFTVYQTMWFQELTTLQELNFFNCDIEHLPSCLVSLSSLRRMMLTSCIKLESLPENGMPPFLSEFSLIACSRKLVQRCQPNVGEDWQLISHIPLVQIDGKPILRQTNIV